MLTPTAVNATREGNESAMDTLPPALSDIAVNVPAHTYIPEEYVPEADERVLLYRQIAHAETVADVDDLFQATKQRRPEMPQAAVNMFAKARIRAWANEHGVKLVSVVGGKLIVEPIEVPKSMIIPMKRYGGRYLPQSKKLTLPLKYFQLKEDDSVMEAIWDFLRELAEEK